jgi:hypothetical protein
MVNSNLKLLQLRFMIPIPAVAHIPVVAHTWCDYDQNHLTSMPNSIRLWQILEKKFTSYILYPTFNTFDFPELFLLDFSNGL